jgi:hypothetical protein
MVKSNQTAGRDTCLTITLATTDPTWTTLGLNTDLCREELNHQGCDIALTMENMFYFLPENTFYFSLRS